MARTRIDDLPILLDLISKECMEIFGGSGARNSADKPLDGEPSNTADAKRHSAYNPFITIDYIEDAEE